MTAIRSPNSASSPEATNASNTVASKSKSSSLRANRLSWSSSTAVLAGAPSAPARAARSYQPILASVGAAAAGLDPASLATLRSVRRWDGVAALPSARTRAVRSEYSPKVSLRTDIPGG